MVCAIVKEDAENFYIDVLILILLEYGLRHGKPYGKVVGVQVLILILLEYGLRPQIKGDMNPFDAVLILILLEYGLRPLKSQIIDFQTLKT